MAMADGAREIVRLIRRLSRSVSRTEKFHRATYRCPKIRLGHLNASFVLNPELLDARSIVYSAGVGTDISFDLACINKFGLQVHAFDPTPRSVQWIATQKIPPQFHFHNYGMASYDGLLTLYPPDDPAHVSYSATRREGQSVECPVRKLSTIMKEFGHTHLDLLKIDIEGAEYDVIDSLITERVFPTQLCVEFHHRWPQISAERTDSAIERLQIHGYRVFDVAASGEELSFIRL